MTIRHTHSKRLLYHLQQQTLRNRPLSQYIHKHYYQPIRYHSTQQTQHKHTDPTDLHILHTDKEQQRTQQLNSTPAVQHNIQHDTVRNTGTSLNNEPLYKSTQQRVDTTDSTKQQNDNVQTDSKQQDTQSTDTNKVDTTQALHMIQRMQYWKKDASDLPEPLSTNKSNNKLALPMKILSSAYNILTKLLTRLIYLLTHPTEIPAALSSLWKSIKSEAHHYWTGTKLFAADIKTAKNLVMKTTQGHTLTRREKRQLKRTFTDTLRIIPFSVFIIVPFMELLLPVALKLFPNMLPSTFRDQHKTNEQIKRELRLRLSMAEFLQESLETLAKEKIHGNNSAEIKKSAENFLRLIDDIRNGAQIQHTDLLQACKLFSDDITLDNLSRSQLVSMCKYIGISTFGTDEMLRFQFEQRLHKIKNDDKLIDEEGIDTLSMTELKQACRERGMRSDGLTRVGYIRNLSQWIDLSLKQQVPSTLLILSRALSIREKQPSTDDIRNALSSLDSELLHEVIRDAGLSDYEQKLESLKRQNELIEEEEENRKQRLQRLKTERTNELMDRIYNVRPDLKKLIEQRNQQLQEKQKSTDSEQSTKDSDKPTADKKQTDTDKPEEQVDEQELARQVASELASLANPSALMRERQRLEELKQKVKKAKLQRQAAELTLDEHNNDDNSKKLLDTEKHKLKEIIEHHETTLQQLDEAEARVQALINAKHMDKQQAEQIITQQNEQSDVDTVPTETDQQQRTAQTQQQSSGDRKQTAQAEQTEPVSKQDTDEIEKESEDSDKSADRLQSRINSMVTKLEQRLNDADISIGDKLHLLDLDHDNKISEDELCNALKLLFDKIDSDAQAHRVAKYIAELCEQSDSNTLTVKQLQELADRLENENKSKSDEDDEDDSDDKERSKERSANQ